jgi:hypothetical protein
MRRSLAATGLLAISSIFACVVGARAAAPSPEALTPQSFEKLSGIHFGFRPADVPEAELAKLPQSFPDGQPGDMVMDEAGGGYRDEIGLVTASSARWAITFDKRAEANMIANAKASKWFPIHVEDPVRGGPVRFDLNPYKSLNASIKGDMNVKPDTIGNHAIHVDVAHEPHMLYFYALLMRARGNDAEFRWALQEMKYWCAWNFLNNTDHGRGFGKGIMNPVSNQPRGAAWQLAALFQLYRVLPKDDPWYPSVKYSIEQNIIFLDGNYRLGTYDNSAFTPYYDLPKGFLKNKLGLMQGPASPYGRGADGKTGVIPAFQAGFQAEVILFGYGLDLDLNSEARAGEYAMSIGTYGPNDSFAFVNDSGELYEANYGRSPPLPDDKVFRNHDDNRPLEGIATSFIENIVPALSMAVDMGAEGAAEAYARAESATQWSGGTSYQFGILPKGKYFRAASGPKR